MPVRFTASEIKANLRFLITTALIVSLLTFVLQIVLMKYKQSSKEINYALARTESEVSQYRNLVWLMHNPSDLSSSFSTEYSQVSTLIESSRIPFIKDHFREVRAAVDGQGLDFYLAAHDHSKGLVLMANLRKFIEDYRENAKVEVEALQNKIDTINMAILGLLVLMTFFFVYSLIYALYGK